MSGCSETVVVGFHGTDTSRIERCRRFDFRAGLPQYLATPKILGSARRA